MPRTAAFRSRTAAAGRPAGSAGSVGWAGWRRAEARAIEAGIRAVLPASGPGPASLWAAMRYAVFPGGKRLRPALAVLGHRICGGSDPEIYRLAASLELVHAFTLVHDDLPCMDDDDLRRGRPTCHRVYGEALAVLAGDALLNLAYETLIGLRIEPRRKEAILASFARAVGPRGVLGGQVEDVAAEGRTIPESALRQIHLRKTASLIAVSLRIGGELAAASPERLEHLDRFGRQLGLLFQQVDDLLNVAGSEETLGRPLGSDERRGKATYPRILGLEASRERIERKLAACRREAGRFGRWRPLLEDLVTSVAARVPGWGRKEGT